MTDERPARGRGWLESLESVNRMLDDLVKRRTLDLVSANRRLLEEIASRKEAERRLECSRDELRSLAEHLQRALRATECRTSRRGRQRPAATQRASVERAPAVQAECRAELMGGARPVHESLSSRELQVFMMLASGTPLKEIAARLSVARTTIASYRTRVLKKMGMTRNSELVRYALKNGLSS